MNSVSCLYRQSLPEADPFPSLFADDPQLQDAVTTAHETTTEFNDEIIKEHNIFELSKQQEMKEMLGNYADGHIEFYRKVSGTSGYDRTRWANGMDHMVVRGTGDRGLGQRGPDVKQDQGGHLKTPLWTPLYKPLWYRVRLNMYDPSSL